MKNKFIYIGSYYRMTVSLDGYDCNIHIQELEDGLFECFSEGGSYGDFKSFGKAVSFAEKTLIDIRKNNP